MRRRDFVTLIVMAAAAARPLRVLAQSTSKKTPVVGVLWHAADAEEEDVYLSVLQKAFHDLGYVEGKNIVLEHRFPVLRIRIGSGHWRGSLLMPNPTQLLQ